MTPSAQDGIGFSTRFPALWYLDKHTANTSDRLRCPIVELPGSNLNFGFMRYGQWWRRHRRAFWQQFHQKAIQQYRHIHESITLIFLEMLLESPSRLNQLIRFNFASVMLKTAYDIDVKDENDLYVQISEEAATGAVTGLVPGKFPVEYLPFLRHIPPWFPGARSQRLWKKWMAAGERLKNVPFEHAKAKLVLSVEDEEIIKNVGAVIFEGMFLGVSLHPEVLRKAHAELDAVVGPYRMPNFGDRDSLVYVNAIIKESMRWHSVLPLGIPHATVADDEFRGYFIPAGTMLLANTWACMNDPEVYDDPDVFRPERFIRDGKLDRKTVRDPSAFVFGYGRRICPGRYFAEDTVFISVARILHVFDITPPVGEDGRPIKIEHVCSDTFVSYPEDFRCTIKARSAAAEALIRACAAEVRAGQTKE
uniref:N/A n=1 Tax=Ganoderma boninense TaxID=34458 RepID=A0A5K1K795_9APHY|nr:N/A [Ganoderma boninense]